jgi:chromosome segregation ATPase
MPFLALAEEAADAPVSLAEPPNAMEQVLPQWKSSLGEIQQASSALLETNASLMAEFNERKPALDALQAKVDAQRAQNKEIMDQMAETQAKSRQAADPAELAQLKGMIARREVEVKAAQDALAAAQLRRSSAESRAGVLRAQAADLEVARQAREVDAKVQDAARVEAVKAETERFKDRAVIAAQQIKLLDEKTRELGKVKAPYLPQARELTGVNGQLKERVASLEAMKAAEEAQMAQLTAQKGQVDINARVQRLHQLLAQRDEVQAHFKDNAAKLEEIKSLKPEALDEGVVGDEAQVQKIERQNAFIEDEIGNLRENIALLEYKVTTLERYNGRNDPAGKIR